MAEILVNDFGLNKDDFVDWTGYPVIGVMSPEYPEFEGSETIGLWTTHMGTSDSHLYQILKDHVVKNADKIDVWFQSPATELIQDPMSGAIIGVKVTRDGQKATSARSTASSYAPAALRTTRKWFSITSA